MVSTAESKLSRQSQLKNNSVIVIAPLIFSSKTPRSVVERPSQSPSVVTCQNS